VRIGLISDIHADFLSLQRVWGHLESLGVEKVLCAGDMVGRGPDPDRTVDFLTERSVIAVRGNHDRWAVERGAGVEDAMGGVMSSAETIEKLKKLSPLKLIPLGGRFLTMVHGTPGSDLEYMRRSKYGPDRLDRVLEELETDVLVVGHTHAPMWYRNGQGMVVNPGSLMCVGTIHSSRSFGVLDLKQMQAQFFHAVSGKEIAVPAWETLEERATEAHIRQEPSAGLPARRQSAGSRLPADDRF